MIKGDSICPPITETQFRALVEKGRLAIEYRLLGIIERRGALNARDISEIKDIQGLMSRYEELMNEEFWLAQPAHHIKPNGDLH